MTCTTDCPTCGQPIPGNIIRVDLNANTIIGGGVAVSLTPREAEVADLLWRSRPRVLSVEYIADRVLGDTADGMSVVPTWIYRIRTKIENNGLPISIKAEFGRGYRWVDFINNNGAGITAADSLTAGSN